MDESKIPKGNEMHNLVKDLPLFDEDIGVDVYCIHGKDIDTPLFFKYVSPICLILPHITALFIALTMPHSV